MNRAMVGAMAGVVAMFFASGTAAADEPSLNADQVKIVPDDPPLKRFAIVANPAGLVVRRYSIQAEIMLVQHLAVTINPVYTHATSAMNDTISGPGGELGIRGYSGRAGAHGFFIGPSILGALYNESDVNGKSNSFNAWGAALDVGFQGMVGPGVLIGGGFGVMYTHTSRDLLAASDFNYASASVASAGIRPRLLFSVGFAF